MTKFRLSKALYAAVADALHGGSHKSLDRLFKNSGVPGDPPGIAHDYKWKEWLFGAGNDPTVDSLAVLGNILEEFMDKPPKDSALRPDWETRRTAMIAALQTEGLVYFRGGRVLPSGHAPSEPGGISSGAEAKTLKPSSIEELLQVLLKGLPRAMHPLVHRRKGSTSLSFSSEYDVQDLLHALLRPWIADVRPEEYTPSYAGSSTRMDFLLSQYSLAIETKLIRDKAHGGSVGKELMIDIDHYRAHPGCKTLWCVIYDPNHHIENPGGLISDLEGESSNQKGAVSTKVIIFPQ